MRAALMLLLMVLTTATAWAYNKTYTVSRSGSTIYIKSGSTTVSSWTATSAGMSSYYWVANESHILSAGMSVKPSANVYVDVNSAVPLS